MNAVGSTITTGYIPYVSTAGRQTYSNTLSTLTVSTLTTTNVNSSTMVTSSLNTNTLTSSALNTTTLTLASLSAIPSGNTISLIGTNSANNQVVTAMSPAYYYGYALWGINTLTSNRIPWTQGVNVNCGLTSTYNIYVYVAGYYRITVSITCGGIGGSGNYYYGYKNDALIAGMTSRTPRDGAGYNPTSMCGIVQMNGSSDFISINAPNNTLSGGGATIVVERLLP